MKINTLTFVFFILLFSGCIPEDPKIEPGVRGAGKPVFNGGASLKSKTASTIEVTAEILKENGYKITERGFCYGTSPEPTEENGKTVRDSVVSIGLYTLKIEELTHNTKYFIRPYAKNASGTEYGIPDLVDSTNIGTGTVSTLRPQQQDVYASKVTVRGKIDSAGEGEILRRGVYYSETKDFSDKKSVESTDETATYLCLLTDLTPSTTYYFQAFAVNTYDTFMGGVDSILTRDGRPKVGEIKIESPGFTDVTLISSVTDGGDETVKIVQRGFCWATTSDPKISDDTIQCASGTGEFKGVIPNLVARQNYYARAYAISNFNKIDYSDSIPFSTKTDVPVVLTEKVTIVRDGYAVVRGIITTGGMTQVKSSGICWSPTNAMPTFDADSVLLLSPDAGGVMSGTLTNLRGGVTYYVRAFATNDNGTSYGEMEQFTTPSIFKTDLKSFPGTPRRPNSAAYFAIGDILYILGGDLGPVCTDELWSYSIRANTWMQLRSFEGGPAKWQSGVHYGAGAYVYGGYDENDKAMSKLYHYNAADIGDNNKWEEKNIGADTLYRTVGCENSNGILYVGGKRDTVKRDVWFIDVPSNKWKKKTDFPVKQYGGIAVKLNGVIYAGMGRDDQDACNGNLWMTSTSDTTATWTLKTSCTDCRGGIFAGVASNQRQRIYVIDEDYYLLEYNPADDVWTKKSQLPPEYRSIHCMYDYNGKIYIGLGEANSLLVYDPLWDN
jgi:hypothetical protein